MPVDMFLKLSNDILGESADDTHNGEIDVIAWNWGMTQSGTTHVATGGGGGKVNVGDISLTKHVDLATDNLIQRCCDGTHIEEGTLVVRKAGGDPLEYFQIHMEDIMVTSYQTGGSAGADDRITETLSLNFRYFEITYTLQNEDGGAGESSNAGWDMGGNVAWGASA